MTAYWTVTDASGQLIYPCVITSGADQTPELAGVAWQDDYVAHAIDGQVDPAAMAWTGTVWAPDMTALRARKWEAVKAKRDAVQSGGCTTPWGNVQTDEASRGFITAWVVGAMLAQANGQPYSVRVTLTDNSAVSLDATATMQLGAIVGTFVSTAHIWSQELRTRIEAAADPAALDAIDIEEGWPA